MPEDWRSFLLFPSVCPVKYRKIPQKRNLGHAVSSAETQNQRRFTVSFNPQAAKQRLFLNHRLHLAVLTVISANYCHNQHKGTSTVKIKFTLTPWCNCSTNFALRQLLDVRDSDCLLYCLQVVNKHGTQNIKIIKTSLLGPTWHTKYDLLSPTRFRTSNNNYGVTLSYRSTSHWSIETRTTVYILLCVLSWS